MTDAAAPSPPSPAPPGSSSRSLAGPAVAYAVLTGLGRIAALAREVVAASLFGVTGAMSAFTIAFQFPNLLRSLIADAVLQAAFIPAFVDLLEKGKREEAFRLASTLLVTIVCGLTSVIAVLVLVAPLLKAVIAPGFPASSHLADLTVGMTQVMLPTIMLLSLTGLLAGMLTAFERFTWPALVPLLWNLGVVAMLPALQPLFAEADRVYAYAFGVLISSAMTLATLVPPLRRLGVTFPRPRLRDPHVARVLSLVVPTALSLGLVNFSALLNSTIGTLVSDEAPAAIDKAFRVYALPYGIVAGAVVTVLYPRLSRLVSSGTKAELRAEISKALRYLALALVPCSVILVVLATPIVRLLYERGAFDASATSLTALALVWWSMSLPFFGASALFWRVSVIVGRVWVISAFACGNLALNAVLALLFAKPLGIKGIVLATVIAQVTLTAAQAWLLRRELDGLQLRRTLDAVLRMTVAAVALGAVSYLSWWLLDGAVGRSFAGQMLALSAALIAGTAAYAAALGVLNVEESRTLMARLRQWRDGRRSGR